MLQSQAWSSLTRTGGSVTTAAIRVFSLPTTSSSTSKGAWYARWREVGRESDENKWTLKMYKQINNHVMPVKVGKKAHSRTICLWSYNWPLYFCLYLFDLPIGRNCIFDQWSAISLFFWSTLLDNVIWTIWPVDSQLSSPLDHCFYWDIGKQQDEMKFYQLLQFRPQTLL